MQARLTNQRQSNNNHKTSENSSVKKTLKEIEQNQSKIREIKQRVEQNEHKIFEQRQSLHQYNWRINELAHRLKRHGRKLQQLDKSYHYSLNFQSKPHNNQISAHDESDFPQSFVIDLEDNWQINKLHHRLNEQDCKLREYIKKVDKHGRATYQTHGASQSHSQQYRQSSNNNNQHFQSSQQSVELSQNRSQIWSKSKHKDINSSADQRWALARKPN